MSSEAAIRAVGLTKVYRIYARPIDRLKQMLHRQRRYYSEFCALRDVSCEVRRGETLGIIGRNGAGKSTLLQLVSGIATPSAGELEVEGRVFALLQLGAGFNPEFTGLENIQLAASVMGLSDEEIRRRSPAIIDFAGIGDFVEQPVRFYSSGMYARLAFAVAIHVDASILIVDEILSVGDAAFAQRCMSAIRAFKERGTLLFVSHDMGAVVSLCERVMWLEAGSVRQLGPAKEVCHDYIAAIHSEREEALSFRIGGSRRRPPEAVPVQDPRHEVLQAEAPNRMLAHGFDPEGLWTGRRGATIDRVELLSSEGEPLASLAGGELVELRVVARAHRGLARPIIGFVLKDRLGQALFGDNTWLSYRAQPVALEAGERIQARFRFQMPYLPVGTYAVAAAISDGSQQDFVQHHRYDEALFIEVLSSHVARGLVGIPMLEVALDRIPAGATADDPSAAWPEHRR
jgi:lipopolysaccharide transport system ATP-binding protein